VQPLNKRSSHCSDGSCRIPRGYRHMLLGTGGFPSVDASFHALTLQHRFCTTITRVSISISNSSARAECYEDKKQCACNLGRLPGGGHQSFIPIMLKWSRSRQEHNEEHDSNFQSVSCYSTHCSSIDIDTKGLITFAGVQPTTHSTRHDIWQFNAVLSYSE